MNNQQTLYACVQFSLRTLVCIVLAHVILDSAQAQTVGTVTFYHNDGLGSPVAATNASGNVIWRKTYDPYGREINNGGAAADSNNIGYTGHRFDEDLDLVYAGARYYDPLIGRFMSVDPAGFQENSIQSFNKYAYANNNPYAFVDPNGEAAFDFNLVLVGVTFGVDDASGQPFWKGRAGLVGVSSMFYSDYYFSNPDNIRGVGSYEGDDRRAEVENIEGRLGGSVAILIWSANLTILEGYERFTTVTNNEGVESYYQDSKAAEFGFDLNGKFAFGKKSQVQVGKNKPLIGFNLDTDFYYETGSLVPWTDLTNDGIRYKWPSD
jgi:RHS repeat-associated protein